MDDQNRKPLQASILERKSAYPAKNMHAWQAGITRPEPEYYIDAAFSHRDVDEPRVIPQFVLKRKSRRQQGLMDFSTVSTDTTAAATK